MLPNCFIVIFRVRELTAEKIGQLVRISGQVVRTHPVHPELVKGTFICSDCNTVISGIEQQFKYTQVEVKSPLFIGGGEGERGEGGNIGLELKSRFWILKRSLWSNR